jgi:hypothetical protein
MVHHMAVMHAHHAVMMAMHPMMMVVVMASVMRIGRLNGCEHHAECGKHRKNT